MTATAQHVGGLEVAIDGAPLDPTVAERLIDARVQDDLLLPDAVQLRFRDPAFELVDGTLFDVGKKLELKLSSPNGNAARPLFTGKIATLAPEFESGGCVFVVRGYDVSHQLNLTRRSRTFQDMTASDIAQKVIGDAGLRSDVASTREVSAFEQQSNETDWRFLWRLAERCGFTLSCVDGTVTFRPAGRAEEQSARLEWGVSLRAFHPRATAVQQVDEVEITAWDPQTAKRVTGRANRPKLDSAIGLVRDQTASAGAGGRLVVSDRVVVTQGEADELAQTTLDHLANAWLEAEGIAAGDPQLKAGSLVEVVGVGRRFGGKYLITSATHVVRGGSGYETRFRVSGRARRSLLDLLTPEPIHGYGESLVIGQVTNVDDPQSQGRVRVKFPALDEDHEGWWARVAAVAATGARGISMSPLVGDEVIVGFEHGDERRPIVLGSLWNGSSAPGALARNAGGGSGKPDGSLNINSEKAVTVKATNELEFDAEKHRLKTSGEAKLDIGAAYDLKAGGDITVKGTSVKVNADGSIELSGRGQVKISGASIDVSATGTVKISGASVMIG